MLNKIIVSDVKEIITFSSPKGRYKEINNRKYYGLSFCTEGQITYIHNGKKYVSDKDHAILLPMGESYSLYGDKTGLFPVINFTCVDFCCNTIKMFPITQTDTYIKDYEQMKSLFLFERNRAKVISIFYNILHRLSVIENPGSNLLFPAIKYMESDFNDQHITNEKLAKMCGISEVYFRRCFLEKHGTTPKQFLIDIRIDRAKQLLTDGFLKINIIAENCGFSNPYHFCRIFKQRTGLTPTEFMQKKQNTQNMSM